MIFIAVRCRAICHQNDIVINTNKVYQQEFYSNEEMLPVFSVLTCGNFVLSL